MVARGVGDGRGVRMRAADGRQYFGGYAGPPLSADRRERSGFNAERGYTNLNG
jgi:hypothetical protein